MSLGRALEQLTAGDREGALDTLLEAWRGTRAPEIADVIDLVSQDITRVLPAIDGSTRLAFQSAWLDIANERRSIDIGRLLATFRREPCTQIRDRLSRLEAREHDPRIARALCDMIEACPCTSTPNAPMWTRIFKLIIDIGDERVKESLAVKLATTNWTTSVFLEITRARVERTIAKITSPEALAVEDALLVEQLTTHARSMLEAAPVSFEVKSASTKVRAGDGAKEQELLELVYADPLADGPRLVYGDWLLERGDPRGEFIALQFKLHRGERRTKAESQREKALLAKHGRRWLGAIEPIIASHVIRFSRGFIDTCAVAFQTSKERELIGHPSWSTVRELIDAPVEIIAHPVMRSLRVLHVDSKTAAGVAANASGEGAPLELEELHVMISNSADVQRELDAIVARAEAYPRLRRLTFTRNDASGVTTADFDWLLSSEVIKHLEQLTIRAFWPQGEDEPRPDLASWLKALEPFNALVRVALELHFHWQVLLTRSSSADAWWLEAACHDPAYTNPLERILRNVPPATFARATLRKSGALIEPTGQLAMLLRRVTVPT